MQQEARLRLYIALYYNEPSNPPSKPPLEPLLLPEPLLPEPVEVGLELPVDEDDPVADPPLPEDDPVEEPDG